MGESTVSKKKISLFIVVLVAISIFIGIQYLKTENDKISTQRDVKKSKTAQKISNSKSGQKKTAKSSENSKKKGNTKTQKKEQTAAEKEKEKEIKRQKILKQLESKKCKTDQRYIQANCQCIDGFYDDGIHDECQVCPYPCLTCENGSKFCQTCNKRPFVSLQHFIPQEKVQQFEDFIFNGLGIFDDEKRAQKSKGFRPNHGKAIWLYNRENWKPTYGHYHHRKYRHSDFYYRGNYTEVQEFVKSLDFFEYTGINFVIFNNAGETGSEHKDHKFQDIISEFFWFSGNTAKQFFARDYETNEKKYVTSNVAYFDDSVSHSISPSDREQYTFRIDGKFKPWIRQYILDNYDFPSLERRDLFESQGETLYKCPEHPEPCEEYNPEVEVVQEEKAQY